ncbi:MAG: hypothetical protein ACAI44_20365 [Candidatus Sericytochromatia bacterium]
MSTSASLFRRRLAQRLAGFALVSLLTGAPALPLQAAGAPIEVFADSVEVDLEAQTTRFSKNVRVLFEPWEARCQQAQVFLDPKSRQVTKVVMQGDVLIQRGTSILKGQRVTLDVRANRLRVEGQVYTRMQFERPINLKMN